MNAVFERDFVGFSVSARFQWLRFAVAGTMGALLLALVLPAYAKNDFATIGTTVFSSSVYVGLGLVLLVAPGAFATVLVHSRAGATLPVLLTTPLSTLSIAGGAFLARALTFFALLLATWPPISSSLLFGGVRGQQLFAASASLMATGLLVATPAYLASAYARRTSAAVVLGYLAAATLVVGLWVGGGRVAPKQGWDATCFSPLHAAYAALDPRAKLTQGPYVLLGWTSALAVGAVLLVAWRLSREGRGTADEARLASFGGRTCRALRRENPVLDRETRGAGLLRGGAGRGLLAALLATEGVFWFLAATTYDPRYVPLHFGTLAMEVLLIVLAVAAGGATSLAAEREGRTLDLVRVTPLTPREIVVGKLAGLLHAYWPCLLIPELHLVSGVFLGVFSPLAVVFTALTGAVAIGAWAVFALWQSLDQSNPNRAVFRTMTAFAIVAVLLAANVGLPLKDAVFSKDADSWIRMAAAFGANPVALTLLPAATFRTGGADAAHTTLKAPDSADLALAALCGFAWIALHVLACRGMYARLFHTYRTRVDG
jgi:ABC-type transport system involved in multi-copper enzyme maturation permease subunit